ncbi:FAD/NAD(P)-binding domain-containing protein [Aureobasidium namibiae CBS 147.97]|uniref:FAD/NAD(P)-binding domain-containing protein n=1 Tax=Aureobasidium namibiae CBS 147.97 TaxID=1043004 RepID=A0A074WYJ9_9PEZI
MSPQPLSIIGAGLGGVTLGKALLERGIPVVLYDRASSASRHGYGISLHASTYKPLLNMLKMDEQTFRKSVAVDAAVGGNGAIDPKKLICPRDVTSSSFRAHRERLEKLIRQGLDIKWESGLEKLEQTPNGTTLYLQNGNSIEGQICVVGADGVHSTTRKSILREAGLEVLPFVTFNGKRKVSRITFDDIYAPILRESNVIEIHNKGALLQVSVNDITAEQASVSWIYSRPAKGSSDRCFKPNRTLSDASEIPKEFYEEVTALKDLPQPFSEIFDEQKMQHDRTLTWLMRASKVDLPQLYQLASNGIFLMGDSAHSQAILGGEGANIAISDGLTLAEAIAAQNGETITSWYSKRFPAWQQSLETSKTTIEEMHGEQAPKSKV